MAAPSHRSLPPPASERSSAPVLARVLVAGDAYAGKSSLIRRALGSGYAGDAYSATLSPESAGVLTLPRVGGVVVCGAAASPPAILHLLDWPGSSAANLHGAREAAAAQLLGGHDFVALVFDVAARGSFAAVSKWARKAQDARAAAGGRALAGVLVGAKADLRDDAPHAAGGEPPPPPRPTVARADAEELAAALGLSYFETSALDGGAAVDAPFEHIATLARAAAAAAAADAPAAQPDAPA